MSTVELIQIVRNAISKANTKLIVQRRQNLEAVLRQMVPGDFVNHSLWISTFRAPIDQNPQIICETIRFPDYQAILQYLIKDTPLHDLTSQVHESSILLIVRDARIVMCGGVFGQPDLIGLVIVSDNEELGPWQPYFSETTKGLTAPPLAEKVLI